ncbi:MAG TPA: DNA polymerase IV [Bacteroidetes bacterium]|nr:DNA polymerase IV [Bacteroidota bacterium]
MNEKRAVVHMDMDTFFVSVERLRDNRLAHRPLIIGGTGGRGVVASCSYETRTFGVRSGMPMKLARRLCPAATIISGDHEQYSRYSDMVTAIVREDAPVFEKASIDEFYVDMTGMERFQGAYHWAGALRARVMLETGLPLSFGLATNKTVAKVATGEIKPNGQVEIPRGDEQGFLDPLVVRKLPMVGEKTANFLSNMGVRRVKMLREIPQEFLKRIMGKPGMTLWQRARGIDNRPVTPYNERKSLSAERTFREDTIDMVGLRATLTQMTERLAFSLRKGQKLTACITVKLRYADFNTVTRQARIPYNSSDHHLSGKALELFAQLYDRRQRVRLLGVRFSHLISGGYQINLFEDTEKQIRLYKAIDKIKFRFGADAVMRGSALGGLGRERKGAQAPEPRRSPESGRLPSISEQEIRSNPREMPERIPDGKLWEAPPEIPRS